MLRKCLPLFVIAFGIGTSLSRAGNVGPDSKTAMLVQVFFKQFGQFCEVCNMFFW